MSDIPGNLPSTPTKSARVFELLNTQGAELLKLVQTAETYTSNARPTDAIAQYQQARALMNSIPEATRTELSTLNDDEVNAVLSHCGDDQAVRGAIAAAASILLNSDEHLAAPLAMVMGMYAMGTQDFKESAAYYQNASDQFAKLADDTRTDLTFQAEYAHAMAQFVSGMDYARRSQRNEALTQIEQAIGTLENDLLPMLKGDADGNHPIDDQVASVSDRLMMDLMSMKTVKYMLSLSNQAMAGDFDAGLRVADEVLKQINETEELTKRARISTSFRTHVQKMLRPSTLMGQAYQAYFKAEELRSHHQWQPAEDKYTSAKLDFDRAATMLLGIGQVANASELHLLSDLLVGQGRRSCNENRELWDTAERYREMVTAIGARFGVQVNTTNTAASEAKIDQKINQEMTWITGVERNQRDNLQKLVEALNSSAVPQATKDGLLSQLSELQRDDSHGAGFLNKVASFCKSAKPIFDGIAGVAGPVAQIFAALHGIPPIPLSGLTQV